MRLATYEHLIAAEDLAETATGRLDAAERIDLDMDGLDEVRLADAGQVVTIDPAEGAGIGGWDVRAVRHALAAVMRRRPEAYHDTLAGARGAARARVASRRPRRLRPRQGDVAVRCRRDRRRRGRGGAPASIHDLVATKEPGLAEQLHYDAYERRSGLVRFLASGTDPEAWATARADELGDALDRPVRGCLARGSEGRPDTRCDRPDGGRACGGPRRQIGRDRRRSPLPCPVADRLGREPVRGPGPGTSRDRVDADDARRWRQSLCLVGGRRRTDGARWPGHRPRYRDAQPGQRLHRHRGRDDGFGARRGVVGARRDGFELGERLRTRLPGRRAVAVVATGPRARRLAAAGREPSRHDDP